MIGYLISRHNSSSIWLKSKHWHPIPLACQVTLLASHLPGSWRCYCSSQWGHADIGVGLGETIFQKETYLRVDKQTCIQKWIQCVSAIYLRNWWPQLQVSIATPLQVWWRSSSLRAAQSRTQSQCSIFSLKGLSCLPWVYHSLFRDIFLFFQMLTCLITEGDSRIWRFS